MANKGRQYAENLVGGLDRSAYNQQRDVAQNTYNTNWENVQNQYKNLQDKLKLQQQRANRDFAEGLVDIAENSFNRERQGSANLANRGLSASGLTNMFNQADTAQKGEEVSKLLKNAGAISANTANKLSQATSKFAQEGTSLMGRLADTLGEVGDAETAAQNRYNQVLAGIAGNMDQREANNALQAAQRAASRAASGRSRAQAQAQNELEEFYKRAAINEVLSSPDMSDQQKQNYLGIMFGIDNAGDAVDAYNNNINATNNYNTRLDALQKAADREISRNRSLAQEFQRRQQQNVGSDYLNNRLSGFVNSNPSNRLYGNNLVSSSPSIQGAIQSPLQSFSDQVALSNLQNQGVTYQDLAALLYGNR